MNIIIIPNEPNPNMIGRHYGLAKALVAGGHEIHTLVWDLPHQMRPAALLRHLFLSWRGGTSRYEDLYIHHIRRLPLFWPYVNGWWFQRQLRKIYRHVSADIIFTESFTNETTVPNDLPFIYDLADNYAGPAVISKSPIYKLIFKVLGVTNTMERHCRNALAITAVSDVLCDYAKQYNQNVVKLPNGVESEIITSVAKAKAKVLPNSLIYVTGFGPWSRPIELMQAVINLRADFPDLSLTLIGGGSEVPGIKAFIQAHDAGSYMQYKGFIHDRNIVFREISKHSIGLNVSEKNVWRDAAHPMKVIEYSALGKKVVSSNLAGVEALHLPNVYTFSRDANQNGLEVALRNALSTKLPASVANKVAIETIRDYDWKRIESSLMQLIDKSLLRYSQPQIVHVTPAYPPNLGGLERVVAVLAATQYNMGRNVSVVTTDQGAKGYASHELFPVTRLRSFVVANTTIAIGMLPTLLRTKKHAIFHLHVTQAYTPEMTWLASKLRRIPYVLHLHLDVPPSGLAGVLLGIYKSVVLKKVMRDASAVIVFTNDQRNEVVQRYGLDLSNVKVIPNGVGDDYYFDEPRTLHRQPRLLFVGRLGYQKNLTQLIAALEGVSERFHTTLVGEGNQADELQRLAKSLKLKNVHFAGRADGQKLIDYYKQSDVFVLPSEREGMPLVLLEAMAMGLPIVATNVTGNRDVVSDGKNGLLVPYGDPVALRAALLKITKDKQLYANLNAGAIKRSKQYSWTKLVQRLDTLYSEAA
ncbi:MAG: glycosyl transferase group 1 [Candidatus Saccharibacteria bacterium]|nr:glycosyl transferase group 1 [Candidatus Saccharibacteria bacterium]